MTILKAYEESCKNFKEMYFQLRPSKDCWDDLFVVNKGEGGDQFKSNFELYWSSTHYNKLVNFYGKQEEELSTKKLASTNSIVELVNEKGDAITCKLLLQTVDEDWKSVLGMCWFFVLCFYLEFECA